jgi:hypothetical protein
MVALAERPVDRLSRDVRLFSGRKAVPNAPFTISMPPTR